MEYNNDVLECKEKYLDIILQKPTILEKVIKRNVESEWSIEHIQRVWEPAGGSTLFILYVGSIKYFLKVKHKSVLVESKLEEEIKFMEFSSLANEFFMIRKIKSNFVPRILFFDEEDEMLFLALEYVEYSFAERLSMASLVETLEIWGKLNECVASLFNENIVHCDLHEENIRFRENGDVVLIDFEESRYIQQKVEYLQSLDYVGKNFISSLGECPRASICDNKEKHNCLKRLKEEFDKYIVKQLHSQIEKCNYDSNNGICTSLDHGESQEIYQSINTSLFKIKGQRGFEDNREILIRKVVETLSKGYECVYIDIGSNNGNFCREISKQMEGEIRCIGLEGFSEFNILAKALSFLENCHNIEFYNFVCGQDNLTELNIDVPCIFSVFSVWHHIINKEAFLNQVKSMDTKYMIFEMAIQPECYEGKTWEEELKYIAKTVGFKHHEVIGHSKDYKRPIILLAKNHIEEEKIVKIKHIFKNEMIKKLKNKELNLSFSKYSLNKPNFNKFISINAIVSFKLSFACKNSIFFSILISPFKII